MHASFTKTQEVSKEEASSPFKGSPTASDMFAKKRPEKETTTTQRVQDGFVKTTYRNGDFYEGQVKRGLKDGLGMLVQGTAVKYKGAFKVDVKHGYGEEYSAHEVYKGEFALGKRQGQGVMFRIDGDEYRGEWAKGLRDGRGEYFCMDFHYDGEWERGFRHGKGRCVFHNCDMYDGEWEEDKMHGIGTMHQLDGTIYRGAWAEGKMEGKGKLTYRNGNVLEGEFHNDKPHGWGTLTTVNGNKYVGEWVRGKRHGRGTQYIVRTTRGTDTVSDVYEGEFKNNLRSGVGTLTMHAGMRYEGEWENDKRHGNGRCIFKDGSIYQGGWAHSKMHGHGVLHKGDRTVVGYWEHGICVGVLEGDIPGAGRWKYETEGAPASRTNTATQPGGRSEFSPQVAGSGGFFITNSMTEEGGYSVGEENDPNAGIGTPTTKRPSTDERPGTVGSAYSVESREHPDMRSATTSPYIPVNMLQGDPNVVNSADFPTPADEEPQDTPGDEEAQDEPQPQPQQAQNDPAARPAADTDGGGTELPAIQPSPLPGGGSRDSGTGPALYTHQLAPPAHDDTRLYALPQSGGVVSSDTLRQWYQANKVFGAIKWHRAQLRDNTVAGNTSPLDRAVVAQHTKNGGHGSPLSHNPRGRSKSRGP